MKSYVSENGTADAYERKGSLTNTESTEENCEEKSLRSEEWKIVAAVIDRICFYVFVLLIIGGHCVILAKMMS